METPIKTLICNKYFRTPNPDDRCKGCPLYTPCNIGYPMHIDYGAVMDKAAEDLVKKNPEILETL